MKITIYELLGLVKDGKIPKKIKYDNDIWEYIEEKENYKKSNGASLNWDYVALYCLKEPVEILEEENKIPEKFKVHSFGDKDENGNFVNSPFPTNEETYRLEIEDITKCLGLDENTIFDEVKEKATNLQEENKRIFSKVNDDELLISNAMNYAEAQDYKSRCEKAREYINHEIFKRTILVGVGTKKYTRNILDNVLNILNGGDKE